MSVTTRLAETNPTGASRLGTLRHTGPCGRRVRCWRPSCRDANADYRTLEVVGGKVLAYCHGGVVPVDSIVMAMIEAAA
jgi:hypothetical protein